MTTNGGFWDLPAEERASAMERAMDASHVLNQLDTANARIAELTDEVTGLREAIAWISDNCNAPESVRVFARNALKEG